MRSAVNGTKPAPAVRCSDLLGWLPSYKAFLWRTIVCMVLAIRQWETPLKSKQSIFQPQQQVFPVTRRHIPIVLQGEGELLDGFRQLVDALVLFHLMLLQFLDVFFVLLCFLDQ